MKLIFNKIEYLDAVKVLTNSNTTNNKHIYCKFISLHLIFFLLFQYRGLAYSPLGGPRGGGPLIGGAIEPGDAPTGLLAWLENPIGCVFGLPTLVTADWPNPPTFTFGGGPSTTVRDTMFSPRSTTSPNFRSHSCSFFFEICTLYSLVSFRTRFMCLSKALKIPTIVRLSKVIIRTLWSKCWEILVVRTNTNLSTSSSIKVFANIMF